jgi:hypothetical protein
MLGDQQSELAAGEGDEASPEDTPLALTERLLYMSAVKLRASAAWDAAKDVGGRSIR